MAPIESGNQLVLAQNQYAFVQDSTKGTVQVHVGPVQQSLSPNDRPVVYRESSGIFEVVSLSEAIKQQAFVPEGSYLVLTNPVSDEKGMGLYPTSGRLNNTIPLEIGRKINIPGPVAFSLWPGQSAQAVPGHHLRSNQYLLVRVYNTELASKNKLTIAKAETDYTPGKLFIIKGTELSFFIPPTGFEVLQEGSNYVREALTLERLEYCILLDEDGNKRYEKGPQVVFPEPTERFMEKTQEIDGAVSSGKGRKFKAIELNDQMGLYIKVTADYTEGERTYKTGEELFITGKEQRIYYPRSEHALIEYKDPTEGFLRQRYYGITIPKGEARYYLDKTEGTIKMVKGPKIFLPDPRTEVVVQRVLDQRTVSLWYPSNMEAAAFNESLSRISGDANVTYLASSIVSTASSDLQRSINRGTANNRTLGGSFEGDTMKRGTKFTPPPTLTLNTKYDGVPTVNVWTGYAVQVVNKAGGRRIVVGPATVLLEYDESLEVFQLSTGKPKTTDNILNDVYLCVDNNYVSDKILVETADLVQMEISLSYKVSFLEIEQEKWFQVKNYVKHLCDHMRSKLKAKAKSYSVKDMISQSTKIVRDTVLGEKIKDQRRSFVFRENGLEVYDVEVLGAVIKNEKISAILFSSQQQTVTDAVQLAGEQAGLEIKKQRVEIQKEQLELDASVVLVRENIALEALAKTLEIELTKLGNGRETITKKGENQELEISQTKARQVAELEFTQNIQDQAIAGEKARMELFEKKMAAITPDLVSAMTSLGNNDMVTKLSVALAPLALAEQSSLGATITRVFKNTPLGPVVEQLLSGQEKKANQ